MQSSAALSYVAPDLDSFEKALLLLKAAGVPCSASVSQSAPATLPAPSKPAKGPLETQWEAFSGKGIKFTEGIAREHGTREAYCAARLREAGQLPVSVPYAEFSAEEERGETYSPGEIGEPDEEQTEGY